MAVKYIRPVQSNEATGLVADTYAQIKQDFGALVEPFTLHSPCPPLLAGVWSACRETELVGSVRRDLKEAVATTVSKVNQCPYCVEAHTIMLRAAGAHQAARDLNKPGLQLRESTLQAIVHWAAATRSPQAPILRTPPFSSEEAPQFIGTALFYHYVNRMVTVLLSETPLPATPHRLKGILSRMAGFFFSGAVRRSKSPGASLDLLPGAALPADLAWARPDQGVATAWACLAAVVEDLGQEIVPPEVRACVQTRVQRWRGEDPGLSEQWVKEDLSLLADDLQPVARLALLTALAPYRVDQKVVNRFREHQPGDRQLLGTVAWASFTTMRRIGRWLV